jgi:hypothetical protein
MKRPPADFEDGKIHISEMNFWERNDCIADLCQAREEYGKFRGHVVEERLGLFGKGKWIPKYLLSSPDDAPVTDFYPSPNRWGIKYTENLNTKSKTAERVFDVTPYVTEIPYNPAAFPGPGEYTFDYRPWDAMFNGRGVPQSTPPAAPRPVPQTAPVQAAPVKAAPPPPAPVKAAPPPPPPPPPEPTLDELKAMYNRDEKSLKKTLKQLEKTNPQKVEEYQKWWREKVGGKFSAIAGDLSDDPGFQELKRLKSDPKALKKAVKEIKKTDREFYDRLFYWNMAQIAKRP